MGKQSRRKGGKKGDKKSHKARQQGRRDRLEDYLDQGKSDELAEDGCCGSAYRRPHFEGDRVWFFDNRSDGENPNSYRGIIKKVGEESLEVLPLMNEKVDKEEEGVWTIPLASVIVDKCGWTLRFDRGERVLCKTGDGWLPATVAYQWPIYEIQEVNHDNTAEMVYYKCNVQVPDNVVWTGQLDVKCVAATNDSDDCIMKHPQSFRFVKGDEVLFATEKAKNIHRRYLKQPWMIGMVTGVDIVGLYQYYAVYEVTFDEEQSGRAQVCHILKDDDEHVAGADASPRHRLMEAIEQDCSGSHLVHLETSLEIDVSVFQDLVISKAIEFASYNALLWLQEHHSVDWSCSLDDTGKTLLDRISFSKNAARFFEMASFTTFLRNPPACIDLGIHSIRDYRLSKKNQNDGTWLKNLIIQGNARTLDFVLSPRNGLAWTSDMIMAFEENQLTSLIDIAQKAGKFLIARMIEDFVSFRKLCLIEREFAYFKDGTKEDEFLQKEHMLQFQRPGAEQSAHRFIRYCRDWDDYHPRKLSSINDIICRMAGAGFERMVRLFVGTENGLLDASDMYETDQNTDEYVQTELSALHKHEPCFEEHNLVKMTISGVGSVVKPGEVTVEKGHWWYFLLLERYINQLWNEAGCGDSFLSYLKAELQRVNGESHDYSYKTLLKYKIHLLEDDPNLGSRLNILEYLVQDQKQTPPNPVDIIRFRQCGCLRWMDQESCLSLCAEARTEPAFTMATKQLQSLGGGRIPSSVSVGLILCFVAVEFDDLQSLQWLIEEKAISIEGPQINGWNLLHAAAYFGRIEILLWLRSHPAWGSLAAEACGRRPFQKAYAVHIAIERGHIFAADRFLRFGCPPVDKSGKSLDLYARRSSHEHVRKWAEAEAKPLRLEREIRKLLGLLSAKRYGEAKKHIIKTKCLDVNTWSDCDFVEFDSLGPRGKSYADTLFECFDCDNSFVLWLVVYLSWPQDSSFYTRDLFWGRGRHFFDRTSLEDLKSKDLIGFANSIGDTTLVTWLCCPYMREIKCSDPMRANLLLVWMQRVMDEARMSKVRIKIMKVQILKELVRFGKQNILCQITCGGSVARIEETIATISDATQRLCKEEEREIDFYFPEGGILTTDGAINMEAYIHQYELSMEHPIFGMMMTCRYSPAKLSRLYYLLAIEGYQELTSWCLSNAANWDASKEEAMTRIASFFGNAKTLDIFLDENFTNTFRSSTTARFQAAMLGAAEAGRAMDLKRYSSFCELPKDPILDKTEKIHTKNLEFEETEDVLSTSVSAAAIMGFLRENAPFGSWPSEGPSDNHRREVLYVLVEQHGYRPENFLYATALLLDICLSFFLKESVLSRFSSLVSFLREELGLNIWSVDVKDLLLHINKRLVAVLEFEENNALLQFTTKWLETSVNVFGLDIQSLKNARPHRAVLKDTLTSVQQKQLRVWAQFDVVKDGQPLLQVKEAVESGDLPLGARDRRGLLLTHMVAAYDRDDVLEWLVDAKGMDLNATDANGRNVLQVAVASKAVRTTRWITERRAREVISLFFATHFRRRLALQRMRRMLSAVTRLQAILRGRIVRKSVRGKLISRLQESQRFEAIWKGAITAIECLPTGFQLRSWGSIREQRCDMRRAALFNSDSFADTDKTLEEATTKAMIEVDGGLEVDDGLAFQMEETQGNYQEAQGDYREIASVQQNTENSILTTCTHIELTTYAVKWLRQGDLKYRQFFVRRMQQLASGDRGRKLAKPLKGSKCTIYETYLEQKSGYRILWTMDQKNVLLVWYVAKHKSVPRLMKLIDDSESRSSRQRMSASELPGFDRDTPGSLAIVDRKRMLLDPLGNVPLKLYRVGTDDIREMIDPSWVPRLHLTTEEREVVEAKGTVLLLGRSGTGKTLCIINRMDYDRRRLAHDPTFSQLFVARSSRLCRYVEDVVGAQAYSTFFTFENLLSVLETVLPKSETESNLFLPSYRMDFARFKREVYKGGAPGDLDPLLVWTNIRSFLKGSIEAIRSKEHILSKEDYVNGDMLGKKRCRLSQENREFVYRLFIQYQKFMTDLKLWDDCDRVIAILRRLEEAKTAYPDIHNEVCKSKIYVDEIQDYTQAECLLFFHLSGPGDLFLAGDPAQSVVEGVEFRFEDIRSVGYHIAEPGRRDLIPQKPKTVNVNFRSHSGILNVAAAVLRRLFVVFPNSAKQLHEDHGLFRGPRPGVFYKVDPDKLCDLVSDMLNGAVFLTHDANVSHWKRKLAGYPLVYGIRAAKGLEFKSVILLDFFSGLSVSMQKPWRNLLLGREGADFSLYFPEVEGQLKLLYTAITRCIEQLFVAETSGSLAGDALVRWLTTATTTGTRNALRDYNDGALATRSSVEDVELMVMTRDEWLSAGIDNAEMAEIEVLDHGDLTNAEALLEKAIYCFEQGNESELARKARTHRASIRFKMDLLATLSTGRNLGSDQVELRAAQLLQQLVIEKLLLEGRDICRSVHPFVSKFTAQKLQQFVLSRLDLSLD